VTSPGFDFAGLLVLSDAELSGAAETIAAEQRRRAIEGGDVEALAASAFEDGFDVRGAAKAPWLVGGLLVCPGIKRDTGRMSHRCVFVSLGGTWCWEHPDLVNDVVRHTAGRQVEQRSISVIAAYDGLEYDVVESKYQTGQHQVQKARSFAITNGAIVHVSTRDRSAVSGHR
jgi:hypothetical protein